MAVAFLVLFLGLGAWLIIGGFSMEKLGTPSATLIGTVPAACAFALQVWVSRRRSSGVGRRRGGLAVVTPLLLLGMSILLFVSAPVRAAGLEGVRNADWMPPILAPGEQAVYKPDHAVPALKGLYSAVGTAWIQDGGHRAEGSGFPVRGGGRTWGRGIRGNQGGSGPMQWRMRFPDDGSLVGRTVEVAYEVRVEYPAYDGGGEFVEKAETFTGEMEVTLSRPGLASEFMSLWETSVLLGAVLGFLGSVGVALNLFR